MSVNSDKMLSNLRNGYAATWADGTLKDAGGNPFSTGAYNPVNPGYWAGSPPATVAEALDRLAAVVSNNGATPIPV